jgi:hypothetical protein
MYRKIGGHIWESRGKRSQVKAGTFAPVPSIQVFQPRRGYLFIENPIQGKRLRRCRVFTWQLIQVNSCLIAVIVGQLHAIQMHARAPIVVFCRRKDEPEPFIEWIYELGGPHFDVPDAPVLHNLQVMLDQPAAQALALQLRMDYEPGQMSSCFFYNISRRSFDNAIILQDKIGVSLVFFFQKVFQVLLFRRAEILGCIEQE